jgi:hypothetical protein
LSVSNFALNSHIPSHFYALSSKIYCFFQSLPIYFTFCLSNWLIVSTSTDAYSNKALCLGSLGWTSS